MSSASSGVAGNGSEKLKNLLQDTRRFFFLYRRPKHFASSVVTRLILEEVTIKKKAEEARHQECLVVYRITVDEDMVNGGDNMHGGCSALLIDSCSGAAIVALRMSHGEKGFYVSQSMNIVYHAPAAIGESLKIINTTMSAGSGVFSARSEIWSETHNRLVASGVHLMAKL